MEWIRVEDSLSKAFVSVIVCRPGKRGVPIVEAGQLEVGGWWRVYGTRVKSVTHWMPMPAPPEEASSVMNDRDLIRALRRIKVETGSLMCLGCGYEHNCSIYGCAVINAAIDRLEVDKSTTLGGTYVSVEWFERVEAELKKYKATGLEPEEISGLCSMSERAKLADLLRLEEYQALGTIDHIRELVQAEKNGRLVVLPCKPDDEFTISGLTFKADHWNVILTAFADDAKTPSGKRVKLLYPKEAEAALKKREEAGL